MSLNDLTGLYVILSRNGYQFGSLRMEYVIVKDGQVILSNMDKRVVEKEFMSLVR